MDKFSHAGWRGRKETTVAAEIPTHLSRSPAPSPECTKRYAPIVILPPIRSVSRFLLECPSNMSTGSNPKPADQGHRRRLHNEPKGWSAVPKSVKAVGA